MRVLVCGGCEFEDRRMLFAVLDELHAQHHFTCVIHGAAPGADTLADEWACRARVPPYRFHAQWKSKGRAAGPIRNARMLAKGRPDLVVAFPGSVGTKDMMHKALVAKVPVLKVRADGSVTPWLPGIRAQMEMQL